MLTKLQEAEDWLYDDGDGGGGGEGAGRIKVFEAKLKERALLEHQIQGLEREVLAKRRQLSSIEKECIAASRQLKSIQEKILKKQVDHGDVGIVVESPRWGGNKFSLRIKSQADHCRDVCWWGSWWWWWRWRR